MPFQSDQPSLAVAAVKRIIDQHVKNLITEGVVVASTPDLRMIKVQLRGSQTLSTVNVLEGLSVQQGDNCVLVQLPGATRWTIIGAYRQGSAYNPSRVEQNVSELAMPDLTVTPAIRMLIAHWIAPPQRPDLVYQVEVADVGDEANAVSYMVAGSYFLWLATTAQTFRVRCVQKNLTYSAWTEWTQGTPLANDADTLDSHDTSYFATADHTHSGYAVTGHTHSEADITDLDHDAVKLQGRTLSATAPTAGQALVWNNTASQWEPGDGGGSGDMLMSVYDTDLDGVVNDSEKLGGYTAASYSRTTHNHDYVYSALGHDHDADYAALTHDHDSDYAALSHTHQPVDVLNMTNINGGRLSISSTDPWAISAADTDTAATLYLHGAAGNLVSLWDGTNWILRTIPATPPSTSLAALSDGMYDIFISWSGSAIAFTLTAWTSSTARNTSYDPIFTDGVETREDDKTKRWIGTVYVESGATKVNPRYCYLWNRDNQCLTKLRVVDTGSTGTGLLSYRTFEGDETNRLHWAWGRNQTAICAFAGAVKTGTAGAPARCGFELNDSGSYSEALDNQNTQTVQLGTTMPKGPVETRLGLNNMRMVQYALNGYTFGYGAISVAFMA